MRKAYKQAQGDVVEGHPPTEVSAAAEGEDYPLIRFDDYISYKVTLDAMKSVSKLNVLLLLLLLEPAPFNTHVHTHTYINTHLHTNTHQYTHTFTHTHTYKYPCTCTTHIHQNAHTHTDTHQNTRTHTLDEHCLHSEVGGRVRGQGKLPESVPTETQRGETHLKLFY